jgi:hypothetical protein
MAQRKKTSAAEEAKDTEFTERMAGKPIVLCELSVLCGKA